MAVGVGVVVVVMVVLDSPPQRVRSFRCIEILPYDYYHGWRDTKKMARMRLQLLLFYFSEHLGHV